MNSKELARLIGVSQSTISRALNGSPQISEQRRNEIMELAKKHNFEFNLNARNLRNQTSNLVGILPSADFSFFDMAQNDYRSRQFSYMCAELANQDLTLVFLNGSELMNDACALARAVSKHQLAGLILWGRTETDEVLNYLKTLKIPVFAMTRCNEKMQFLPSVSINSYQQGWLVGEHLVSRGYRRIATIRSTEMITTGFMEALNSHGISLTDDDVFTSRADYQDAYDMVIRNIARIRTYEVLFTQHDISAAGAVNALRDCGLSIPNDIAVVGNNNLPVSQWSSPKLTTIEPFLQQQAEVTCRRIVSMIRDGVDPVEEKHHVIQPRLIIRESCP